jgi:hypothetical protein
MILRGHGVEITWDGETLVARGTTTEGRKAVHPPEGSDQVTLTVAEIDAVALLEAPRRVGGVLIVVERNLEEHRLHFRRDTRLEFAALAAELDEAVERERAASPHPVDLTDRSMPSAEAGTAVSA